MKEGNIDNYICVTSCPLCRSEDATLFKSIKKKNYYLRDVKIAIPDQKILILKCKKCDLLYKKYIVRPEFLVSLSTANKHFWSDDIGNYIDVLKEYVVFREAKSVIDIGAGDCSIGKAIMDIKQYAAVDIMSSQECNKILKRNYYTDDYTFKELVVDSQFDIALLIDVIEHLQNPFLFLKNVYGNKNFINMLIHTGDSDVIFNKSKPTEFDWYLKLPEHNMCFNESSIRYLFNMLGWSVRKVERVRSKLYYSSKLSKRVASKLLYYSNLLSRGYVSSALPGRYSSLFDLYSFNHMNVLVSAKNQNSYKK
jgi:hypothetical protein